MLDFFLNFIFPRTCCICKRYGYYICDDCKKLLKRNLPECYICRRLSPSYSTHSACMHRDTLENVFVAWEYNHMSSRILKIYKYKNVRDISTVLSSLVIAAIEKSAFTSHLENSLLVPIPISSSRNCERGFNQMDYITSNVGEHLNLDVNNRLVFSKNTQGHQAKKSRLERDSAKYNPFYIKSPTSLSKYKSITLVDDVITTGNTLGKIAEVVKSAYGHSIPINAICMFRGKPYYLTDEPKKAPLL